MKRQVMLLLSVMLSMLTAFAQEHVGGMVSGQVKSTSGEELINAIITFRISKIQRNILRYVMYKGVTIKNYLMASTHMLFLISEKITLLKRIGFW